MAKESIQTESCFIGQIWMEILPITKVPKVWQLRVYTLQFQVEFTSRVVTRVVFPTIAYDNNQLESMAESTKACAI